MAQKQNRNSPETESSRKRPRPGNRMVEHHAWGFVPGKFSCFSARDRSWLPFSRLGIRLICVVCLENENEPGGAHDGPTAASAVAHGPWAP